MKPFGDGVALETAGETSFCIQTLTCAKAALAPGLADTRAPEEFDGLQSKIMERYAQGPRPVVLDGEETKVLRDACRIGQANVYVAMGILGCFQILEDIEGPAPNALRGMFDHGHPLLKTAANLLLIKNSPAYLTGLLDLYGPKSGGTPGF